MATSQKSAPDRLTDIWKDWGLGTTLSNEDAKAQKFALAGLAEALSAGAPALAVRSAQALLVDPEFPGASARPLFEPLWQTVREHWGAAGTGNHTDVMRLQALVLAAWDEQSATTANELFPTLVSPWGFLHGRDRQRRMISSWLEGCQRDEQADWANKAQQLAGLEVNNAALQASYHSQELLWWGQALYCYSLRRSFRRIADPDELTWRAAVEAADRSVGLPVEPAASYLQEVLRTAGMAIDEKRTVWEHVRSLSLVLLRHERVPMSNEFAELVREDAFGLPVSLLCLDPGVAEDVLRDSLGVEADVSLDRGEWAAWVFRELLLQRRWPAPGPTS